MAALRMFRRSSTPTSSAPAPSSSSTSSSQGSSGGLSPAALAARAQMLASPRWELVPVKSVEQAIADLPDGAPISVTCSPVKGIDHTVELATRLIGEGHDVVPHFAARMVEGPRQAASLAGWCRDHHVREVFVIGGDAQEPQFYKEAVPFIRDFLDAGPGVAVVGVAGYPDGHAMIETPLLRQALADKQALFADAGVAGEISTQMCFDSDKIVKWLTAIRADGVTMPVRLGIPGAVERAKLLSMGTRLGIGASLRFLRKNAAVMSKLVGPGGYDPLELLDEIAPAAAGPGSGSGLGIDGLHVFTFNAMAATIDWWKHATGA